MTANASDDKSLATKLAILEAMNKLCRTRPFARLGVIDIAKEAGIGRSSFYYHFTDRNAAVHWLSHMAFDRGIDQIGRTLSYFNGHYATTRVLVQFKPLIVAATQDNSYSGAELFFIRQRTKNLVETLSMRGITPDDELLFQVRALAASEQSMTSAFIDGDFDDMDAKTFCRMLCGIVPQRLWEALGEKDRP